MKIALVEFSDVGKKYHFGFDEPIYNNGDFVVVETVKGLEVGRIYLIKDSESIVRNDVLKNIIRLATSEDLDLHQQNIELSKNVTKEVKQMVKDLELDMKVLDSEYTLDRKKLTVYFEAENRVDFRELVKIMSEEYLTRIELRQIGPRDAAKLIGGIGPCGLLLCCTTFIGEFDTVSIKMAKNQQIALNPQKISGVCGKLLCCIKYEDDTYTYLKDLLPDVGDYITVDEAEGKVLQIDIINQKVKVRFDDHEMPIVWVDVESISN